MALHRRRQRQDADDSSDPSAATHKEDSCEDDAVDRQPSSHKHKNSISSSNQKNAKDTKVQTSTKKQSFYVTKFVILRLVGFVYFIAFIGAYYQNQGLMGSNGLVPAYKYMEQLRANYDSPIQGFMSHPTIYWFISSTKLEDWHLDATAAIGTLLSINIIDSWLVMVLLWILDFSIVTVAGNNSFYSYGWESQLLETGFLAIWLCDVPRGYAIRHVFKDAPTSEPSVPVLWLFRWLCARISIGAGLIKLRGSECWQNKTCLYYHFETQPIPRYVSLEIVRRGDTFT